MGFTRFNRERRLFFVFFGVISSFPPFSVGAVEAGVMHCGFCGLSSFILSDSEVLYTHRKQRGDKKMTRIYPLL